MSVSNRMSLSRDMSTRNGWMLMTGWMGETLGDNRSHVLLTVFRVLVAKLVCGIGREQSICCILLMGKGGMRQWEGPIAYKIFQHRILLIIKKYPSSTDRDKQKQAL